jgi:hypothetical protein
MSTFDTSTFTFGKKNSPFVARFCLSSTLNNAILKLISSQFNREKDFAPDVVTICCNDVLASRCSITVLMDFATYKEKTLKILHCFHGQYKIKKPLKHDTTFTLNFYNGKNK